MEEKEELLVFGYSCKLFRDDEKASFVDQGKHLIPWMGNQTLMIDRYDVRGALYDLTEAESKDEVPLQLTESEAKIEELCDYERYYALYQDETHREAYEEEELKRLQQDLTTDTGYSQVAFSYTPEDVSQDSSDLPPIITPNAPQNVQETDQVEDKPFFPPPELCVPDGMIVPTTIKQNKIIQKTAKFIVTQGAQMEILIKAKQAGNNMFGFLSFDNVLNPYYKHMVTMIRNGRYKIEKEQEEKDETKDNTENQYLHPKLSTGIKPDLTPGNVLTPGKSDKDCAYSKLVNKIKGKQEAQKVNLGAHLITGDTYDGTPLTNTPLRGISPIVDSPASSTFETPVGKTSSYKSNKRKRSGDSLVKGLVDYPSFNQTFDGTSDDDSYSNQWDTPSTLSLYTASDVDTDYSNIKWPPPDVQMIIDKMASYIIKNGPEFESVVISRGDKRFNFMKKTHEYFPYYQCKIKLYKEVYGNVFKNKKARNGSVKSRHSNKYNSSDSSSSSSSDLTDSSRHKNKKSSKDRKVIPTISFSIKPRDQETNLEKNSTFPLDSSSTEDEDMDEEEREKRRVEREERREKKKQREKEEREERLRRQRQLEEAAIRRREEEVSQKRLMQLQEEKLKSTNGGEEKTETSSGGDEDMYDIFKYAQEMGSNSTEDTSNQGSAIDNKQVERKKKAAEFLSKLKKTNADSPKQVIGPQLPPNLSVSFPNSPRSSISRDTSSSPDPLAAIKLKQKMDAQSSPMLDKLMNSRSTSPTSRNDVVNASTSQPMTMNVAPAAPVISLSSAWEDIKNERNAVLASESSDEEGVIRDSEDSAVLSSKTGGSSHSRRHKSRKKKRSYDRSSSRSPSSKRDRKKKKHSKSSSKKRKKNRSRSRSPSRSRSKSHRSSHKKKHNKHREHKKKKSRRYKSPSISSSSSDNSYSDMENESTPTYKKSKSNSVTSDSDPDIQIVEPANTSKHSSRASSIVSIDASDNTNNSDKTEESSTIQRKSAIPSFLSNPPLLSSPSTLLKNSESTNLIQGSKEGEKSSLFKVQNSSAMAKIAEGLRAKVHALLDKDVKTDK